MILSDSKIIEEIDKGNIVIKPFDIKNLGSNSYDVHLSKFLAIYKNQILDCKLDNEVINLEIPKEGLVLEKNILYLGSTLEYTETNKHVPFLEGKSSIGRLGINIHSTAGKGDVGYRNTWTFEISVIHPVRVYADMPIAQLIYFEVLGNIKSYYYDKKNAKYNKYSANPIKSKMHLNFNQ